MPINHMELVACCRQLLKPDIFHDYCPNGLQVEGSRPVSHISTAVTASLAAIEHARDSNADMLLVHHGILWDKGNTRLVGYHKQRIARLLESGIHLLAYHLPLDAHANVGNNAQLADILGISMTKQKKPTDIVAFGHLANPMTTHTFTERLVQAFGKQVQAFGIKHPTDELQHLAWCTGAGGDFFEMALANESVSVEGYITGEISERHFHLANEYGMPLFAIGHHASERYGVQALARWLVTHFNEQLREKSDDNPLSWDFFDEPNPI